MQGAGEALGQPLDKVLFLADIHFDRMPDLRHKDAVGNQGLMGDLVTGNRRDPCRWPGRQFLVGEPASRRSDQQPKPGRSDTA